MENYMTTGALCKPASASCHPYHFIATCFSYTVMYRQHRAGSFSPANSPKNPFLDEQWYTVAWGQVYWEKFGNWINHLDVDRWSFSPLNIALSSVCWVPLKGWEKKRTTSEGTNWLTLFVKFFTETKNPDFEGWPNCTQAAKCPHTVKLTDL